MHHAQEALCLKQSSVSSSGMIVTCVSRDFFQSISYRV